MEEAQGVRLHDLREIHNATQLFGGFGNTHCQDRVASFGRGDQVRDGTDAADTRHQGRHFIERTTLAELLETAELGNMKMRVLHHAMIVELDRDLGMSFDASDGIDYDSLHLALLGSEMAMRAQVRHASRDQ